MVTHDPKLAQEHAKIIYQIKDGKLEKKLIKINKKWKAISVR